MNALICPLCSLKLMENTQGIACINHHQFDRSKEGYFNLLPVHYKNSLEPGDAKQQLIARRTFLNEGYFLPLVVHLKKIISEKTSSLLDIGCGEGYFTRQFIDHCSTAEIYGVDIAKAGIRLAAKCRSSKKVCDKKENYQDSKESHYDKKENYIVASSHLLPVASESMDVITRIYAPSKDEELRRVIKPEGRLIIVTPGEKHLLSLRQKIYKTINPHPKPLTPTGFTDVEHQSVIYPINVPIGELTEALLKMTPFEWKLDDALRAMLTAEGLVDTLEFQISVYKPH